MTPLDGTQTIDIWRIKDLADRTLTEIELGIVQGLLDFEPNLYQACLVSSLLFAFYVETLGIHVELESGSVLGHPHTWAWIGNVMVDLSVRQFGETWAPRIGRGLGRHHRSMRPRARRMPIGMAWLPEVDVPSSPYRHRNGAPIVLSRLTGMSESWARERWAYVHRQISAEQAKEAMRQVGADRRGEP